MSRADEEARKNEALRQACAELNRRIDEMGIRDCGSESEDPSDDELRAAAKRIYEREGEIEIDPGAPVSRGGDPGAYIQAWVWVYYDDVKEPEKKPDLPPLANPHKHRSLG